MSIAIESAGYQAALKKLGQTIDNNSIHKDQPKFDMVERSLRLSRGLVRLREAARAGNARSETTAYQKCRGEINDLLKLARFWFPKTSGVCRSLDKIANDILHLRWPVEDRAAAKYGDKRAIQLTNAPKSILKLPHPDSMISRSSIKRLLGISDKMLDEAVQVGKIKRVFNGRRIFYLHPHQ